MMPTKLTLDDLLQKLPKIERKRGEEITSGLAHRKLTLDQLESVVGGRPSDHTCGTVTGASEDACDDTGAE